MYNKDCDLSLHTCKFTLRLVEQATRSSYKNDGAWSQAGGQVYGSAWCGGCGLLIVVPHQDVQNHMWTLWCCRLSTRPRQFLYPLANFWWFPLIFKKSPCPPPPSPQCCTISTGIRLALKVCHYIQRDIREPKWLHSTTSHSYEWICTGFLVYEHD